MYCQRGGYNFASFLTEPHLTLKRFSMVTVGFVDVGHNSQLNQPTHNILDESFYSYALKEQLRVGTKVNYPRLAIIFALLVFCEIVKRPSYGISRFDFFYKPLYDADAMDRTKVTWSAACYVCLHWHCVSERPHAWGWCDILLRRVSSVTFFFVFSLALYKCIRTYLMGS